jgi:hypothetical protein
MNLNNIEAVEFCMNKFVQTEQYFRRKEWFPLW